MQETGIERYFDREKCDKYANTRNIFTTDDNDKNIEIGIETEKGRKKERKRTRENKR